MDIKTICDNFNRAVWLEHQCNCFNCVQKRSTAIMEDHLLEAAKPLTFVPLCHNPKKDFAGQAHPARYVDNPHTRFKIIAALIYNLHTDNINRLKVLRFESTRKLVINCAVCGKVHFKHGSVKWTNPDVNENMYICEECQGWAAVCTGCNEMNSTLNSVLVWKKPSNKGKLPMHFKLGVDYTYMCHRCYRDLCSICSECSQASLKTDLIGLPYKKTDRGIDTFYYCKKCAKKVIKVCSACGGMATSNPNLSGDENILCPVCVEENRGYHGYDYKPLKFHFLSIPEEGKIDMDTALFMGFELEVEAKSSVIQNQETMGQLINETIGPKLAYTMHDGTLENGVEMVSHPFTWEHYKAKGIHIWEDALLFFRKYGWKADTPRAGFHIHTSKVAWGNFQLYKLMKFMYDPSHKEFVIAIAGRRPNRYCAMTARDFNEAVLVAKDKKNRSMDHYGLINMNTTRGHSSDTVEFRMFKGSLEPLLFHKNIEFVHSIYMFTKNYSSRQMTKSMYLRFIRGNRSKYNNLNEYLKLKGII